ncbi:hypothetical protein EVAR_13437_1 [Eumeta japonica]|uniref:Uncharacterized protein n=1 Tax=Eumeta variegata TaxID=151549 RepID=A0A4C1V626_EUMVA|nr:hypothetical protein EVAR_13437_1 [Eumeta japonica]
MPSGGEAPDVSAQRWHARGLRADFDHYIALRELRIATEQIAIGAIRTSLDNRRMTPNSSISRTRIAVLDVKYFCPSVVVEEHTLIGNAAKTEIRAEGIMITWRQN